MATNRIDKELAKLVHQKELDDYHALELRFIRRLRDEFTTFLEAKGWVSTVDAHYWRGTQSNSGHAGLAFLVDTSHPDFGDVELKIEIEKGPN